MLREIISNDLFTILIVIAIVIVAMARLASPNRFTDFIYVIGNSKYLKIYSRDQKFLDTFDALLFSNFVLSASVFIYIIHQYLTDNQGVSINLLFKLILGIAVFILIKILLERLIASVFEIDTLIDQYLFQKTSYKNYLGLILIPVNAVLIFSISPSITNIYIIVILLLLLNIIGLISSFKTHQNTIKGNLFYFILYLCALEIAPYIILYKVFIT